MEKREKILFAIIFILLLIIIGMTTYDYFMNYNKDKKNNDVQNEVEVNYDNDSNNSEVKENNNITFTDYANILEKNRVGEEIVFDSEYTPISRMYLDKSGNVYVIFSTERDLRNTTLEESDIEKIKSLKLDNKNRYKLPLSDIVLIDTVRVSQDASPLIFFEDKNGKVYSFHASQTGAWGYPLFNENGEINIKEEQDLKNIVKFGQYSVNEENPNQNGVDAFGLAAYGIDINGEITVHPFENY